MEKEIVVFSHTFPPYGGVAGRRWLLFAEDLRKLGHKVTIISAKGEIENSPWNKPKNLKVIYWKDTFPAILKKRPKKFSEKILYHFWAYYVKLINPGHPFDKGYFWIKSIEKNHNSLPISKNSICILTGAPFSTFILSKTLKKMGAKVVLDYRDPYTWKNAYGFDLLSKKRQAYELNQEKTALELADTITAPSSILLSELLQKYPEHKNKTLTLPHPLDSSIGTWKENNEVIKGIYAGRIYPSCENELLAIAQLLNQLDIPLDLYTDIEMLDPLFKSKLLTYKNINLFNQIKSNELHKKLLKYSFYCAIQPKNAINYISTKYPDLVKLEIPIIIKQSEGKLVEELKKIPKVIVYKKPEELSNLKSKLITLKPSNFSKETFLKKYSGNIARLIELFD